MLKIDPSSSVPVYSQIISQLKHAIASGILRPGEYLPSLRDTAKSLRINPHTVAKAYRELEVMGLVRTDQGRGTYVTGESADLSDSHRQEELRRLASQLVVEGYHLGLSPDQILAAVQEKLAEMSDEFRNRDAKVNLPGMEMGTTMPTNYPLSFDGPGKGGDR